MCHVLIIEDESIIAMLIEDTLADCGATSFDFAATEDEAVALAGERRPDFITADINLLAGSGHKAVERISDLCGPIATVVISGNLHPPIPQPPPEALVLKKPFRMAELSAYFRANARFEEEVAPRTTGV